MGMAVSDQQETRPSLFFIVTELLAAAIVLWIAYKIGLWEYTHRFADWLIG